MKLLSPDYSVQGDTVIFSLTGLEKTAGPGLVRSVLEISTSLFSSDKASLKTLQYVQHYLRERESLTGLILTLLKTETIWSLHSKY